MDKLSFSAILLDEEKYREYNIPGEKERFLRNLTQVNIFVGINNAGKSRLIRKFFYDEDLKFLSEVIDLGSINASIKYFLQVLNQATAISNVSYYSNIAQEIGKIEIFPYLRSGNSFNSITDQISKAIKMFNADQLQAAPGGSEILGILEKYQNVFKDKLPKSNGATILPYERIYIPTLRGLRPVQIMDSENKSFSGHKDNYKHRTIHDYFQNSNNNNIFSGLSFYEDLDKHYRGDSAKRALLRNFENFLSETFFDKRSFELIPTHGRDVVTVKIGNHEEPIFHLGDGIQQIIILTYPLFFRKGRNLKVFYEEPDSNLHPGFQRIFLETLMRSEFSDNQYFITTHSNHFLDMTLDKQHISIYTCEQLKSDSEKPNFHVSNVEGPDTSILSLLGVKNSSVFLSNCTVWVEGITDRIYLRKYLEIYQKDKGIHFLEDIHFSFVEYGGNNITHWSFLDDEDPEHKNIYVDRLCGRLFLITDSDCAGFNRNGKPPKKATKKSLRFLQLKERLGDDRFYCLKCREVENLLTPQVLASVVGEYEGRIIDSIIWENNSYAKEYLGRIIEDNVNGLKRSYSTDSGSILYKVDFAKKAVEYIHTLADMSEEAVVLAERIYQFVMAQNK